MTTTEHDLERFRNAAGPCLCADCENAHNSPHPDTARADAAERMLAGVMAMLRNVARKECERLESELHAARAEAARLDAELAAMGGLES